MWARLSKARYGVQSYSGGLLGSCLIICGVMEKQAQRGTLTIHFVLFITVASIAVFYIRAKYPGHHISGCCPLFAGRAERWFLIDKRATPPQRAADRHHWNPIRMVSAQQYSAGKAWTVCSRWFSISLKCINFSSQSVLGTSSILREPQLRMRCMWWFNFALPGTNTMQISY